MITPFEIRVLQAIGHEIESWSEPSDVPLDAHSIQASGMMLFGPGWTGSQRNGAFPLLNRFLGRLRSKGFVQREDWHAGHRFGTHQGSWILTNKGQDFLGLPNLELV